MAFNAFLENDTKEETDIAQTLNLQMNMSAISAIQSKLGKGPSLFNCEECGEVIPEGRRLAVAGCRYCIDCQSAMEKTR
jgi:phage/conjugal plasmid C-4 type zinc finger TraR family protein